MRAGGKATQRSCVRSLTTVHTQQINTVPSATASARALRHQSAPLRHLIRADSYASSTATVAEARGTKCTTRRFVEETGR